jgi:hypothetical protein
VPPFVVAPTDGARHRRWRSIAFAGAAVAVVGIAAAAGVGALLVLGARMISDQGRAAVIEYLTAVQDQEYAAAYAQLCADRRERVDVVSYARQLDRRPAISSFDVGTPVLDGELVVPATVRYRDGTSVQLQIVVAQDADTGAFEVCGGES